MKYRVLSLQNTHIRLAALLFVSLAAIGGLTVHLMQAYADCNPNLKIVTFQVRPGGTIEVTNTPPPGGEVPQTTETFTTTGGTRVYDPGTTLTITPHPDGSHSFLGWEFALTGTANPGVKVVDADMYIGAKFSHKLVVTPSSESGASGTVRVTGPGVDQTVSSATTFYFANNAVVTLQAQPASGSMLHEWSGDASGSASSIQLTMTSDKTAGAYFIREACEVAVTVSPSINLANVAFSPAPSGGTSTNGNVITAVCTRNQNVTITVNPGQNIFDGWSGAVTSSSRQITLNVNEPKNLTAALREGRMLTVSVVEGTMSCTPAPENAVETPPEESGDPRYYYWTFEPNTAVTVTAAPNAGYDVYSWMAPPALGVTGNPLSIGPFTLTDNIMLSPWLAYTCTLTTAVQGAGEIAVTPGTPASHYANKHFLGTTVTLTANPTDPAYVFQEWQGNVTGTTNPTTLLMNGNKTVTAVFAEQPADLLVGAVNTSPPASGKAGDSFTVAWTGANAVGWWPTSGQWTDGVYLSTDNAFDAGDYPLNTTVVSAQLDPGESYSAPAQVNVTLPDVVPGPYFVLIRLNVNGDVPEEGDHLGNNTASSAIIVLDPEMSNE